ncbi:immunity 22 family protein [Dickeya zeae]|uniref:immunity 22 family protein n=1 Tax=Dickeya zeae TaxID=204042 RepID=UPI000C9A46E1|nr:immunity 22 family protein [Dickeya zeae]AUQ24223.1 hypothetical protein C1O30_03635 [Dickeya zeae]UJR57334.1 immunity 22 family protein [Dickeya zeae]
MENIVHIWVGSNFQSEEKYMDYFELDYSVEGDFSNQNYKLCGFCRDVGIEWYDEDFIGIIPRHDEDVSLDELLIDAAVDRSELSELKKKCKDLGIEKANAIFWYQDPSVVVNGEADYNGLKYIGSFKGD